MVKIPFLFRVALLGVAAVALCVALHLAFTGEAVAQSRPQNCANWPGGLASIFLINEHSEFDDRPVTRIDGGGFKVTLILSCKPAHWQWRVLEHPDNATSTPQVISYEGRSGHGFGTHLVQSGGINDGYTERVPADLYGDTAGEFYHKYEFEFKNDVAKIGPLSLNFLGHPSLDADLAYQFEVVFFDSPPPAPGNPVTGQAQAYTLRMPPYQSEGILARILRALNPLNFMVNVLESTATGAHASTCAIFEDGAGVYSDHCEDPLVGTGFNNRSGPDAGIGPLTPSTVKRLANIHLSKKAPGANICWTAGAVVPIEVTFSHPVAPVAGSQVASLPTVTDDERERFARTMRRPGSDENLRLDLSNVSGGVAIYDSRAGPVVGRFQKTLVFNYVVEDSHETPDADPSDARRDPIKLDSPSSPGGYLKWDQPVAIVDDGGNQVEVAPVYLPSEITLNRDSCVDGDSGARDEFSSALTFNGIMQGTPAELTYRRLIVARGWTVALNLMIAFMSIILAWMGLTIIVNQHIGRQSTYSWREMFPRFILAMVAGATSFWWCRLLIDLSDALSRYVASALNVQAGDIIAIGAQVLKFSLTAGAGAGAARGAAAAAVTGGGITSVGTGVAAGLVAVLLIYYAFAALVLMQFIVRIVLINLLMMFAPLAMTLWALPQTSGWGRRWLQMWLVTLAQHALQLFGLAMALFFIRNTVPDSSGGGGSTEDFIWGMLLSIASLYVTYKIPSMLGTGGIMEGFTQTLFYVTSIASHGARLAAGTPGRILMQHAPVGSAWYGVGRGLMGGAGMGAQAESIHKGRTTP